MDYSIAVLDIGKTNKKIAIFSSDLKIISKESTEISQKKINDILCDDLPAVDRWVLEKLKATGVKHKIGIIAGTTFGATITCLSKNGELTFPVISYMHEPGEEVSRRFFETFGNQQELYLRTATPAFGQLLSVGKQLFWLREKKPSDFKKIKNILFLPQYMGYFLTGERAIELTSVGCHTYLYDFCSKKWSDIARKMGVTGMFPKKFSNPWDLLGKLKPSLQTRLGFEEDCGVAVGIHDSNASLLPYLLAKKGKFVLASTGTWGVFMFRGGEFYLSKEDFCKDTLYYLDAFGKPVRSARFAMGAEHDHYCDIIKKEFGIDPKNFKPDEEIIEEILNSRSCFIAPGIISGSGQFPDSKPKIVDKKTFHKDAKTAYTVLNISLAIQSYFAIMQALGKESSENIPIFVEGGFRNNLIYLAILSTIFPNRKVVATDIQESTSLGAAICGKCAAEGIPPEKINPRLIKISEKPVEKLSIDQELIQQYIAKFERHCTIP